MVPNPLIAPLSNYPSKRFQEGWDKSMWR